MLECDVFVIGCGPAGASLACYLAQKNIKVIVAEKKKNLDIPVRCAGLVPVNIAGLFDFKIGGINNQTEYLETYTAKNPSEKFHLISKTNAPGFILDRDTFIKDIASRFTKSGGKLLKGTKVISIKKNTDGFTLDLLDSVSKNHFKAKAKIIAGADGPLSLVGRFTGSANKSFMPAIQQNPPMILKNTNCSKVFFSPYISCGYGWLFPKTDSVNLGVGAFFGHKTIHSEHKAGNSEKSRFADSGNWGSSKDFDNSGHARNSDDFDNYRFGKGSGNSGPNKDSGYSGLGGNVKKAGIPLKNILAAFTGHLEFSGIFSSNINPRQSIFKNSNYVGDNNKENIHQLLPANINNSVKHDKSLEINKQLTQAVTGLIPDSGIVENPGSKDGVILCGDAAGLCNPITGAGIYNAIYSAKLTSEIIIKSLRLNNPNILQEIKEIYKSQFGDSINRALRKKLMQKNNWPQPTKDMNSWPQPTTDTNNLPESTTDTNNLPEHMRSVQNGYGFAYKDTMKFSDLIRQTWVAFKDYWH